MKKTIYFLAATVVALSFASCSKDDDGQKQAGETTEVYIDATSKTVWNYYSLSDGKLVGTADESAENNAVWSARKDWDIAIQRYNIRTNSGEFTATGAQGGVYTFDINNKDEFGNINVSTSFTLVENNPDAAEFVTDKAITSTGMGGVTTTVVRSEATVIQMKKGWNADKTAVITLMPPIYLQAPVYIFRTADGNNYYKVQFTQYVNEDAVTGHVKFNVAQIYKK